MITTINTFERLVRQAIKENGKETLLAYINNKNHIAVLNSTIWFFPDWDHVEITTNSHVLRLQYNGEYEIDVYIHSDIYVRRRREQEGYINDDSILNTLLSILVTI